LSEVLQTLDLIPECLPDQMKQKIQPNSCYSDKDALIK
jgi:hypothetical protein